MAEPCHNNISLPSTYLEAHSRPDGLELVEELIQCLFLQENNLVQNV